MADWWEFDVKERKDPKTPGQLSPRQREIVRRYAIGASLESIKCSQRIGKSQLIAFLQSRGARIHLYHLYKQMDLEYVRYMACYPFLQAYKTTYEATFKRNLRKIAERLTKVPEFEAYTPPETDMRGHAEAGLFRKDRKTCLFPTYTVADIENFAPEDKVMLTDKIMVVQAQQNAYMLNEDEQLWVPWMHVDSPAFKKWCRHNKITHYWKTRPPQKPKKETTTDDDARD